MTLPEPFDSIELPLHDRRLGKVRVSYAFGSEQRLFVTTDRLSAFDRIIARVPYKGQVLNQLAAWWFEQTADIVQNHVVSLPDPNVLIAREAAPLSVEVVVRGHISGVTNTALWTQYAAGARSIYGHQFPENLTKNTALPEPIITPTTKGNFGEHDVPLAIQDVVAGGHVDREVWDQVRSAALAVFERGRERAADGGLILADTKYEFGLDATGAVMLIDEVHTPDSSRYWVAETYEEQLAAGCEPESLDKEIVRRALADVGYTGKGEVPQLPSEVWEQTSDRYIETYERLTGLTFERASYPAKQRIIDAVSALEVPS